MQVTKADESGGIGKDINLERKSKNELLCKQCY